MSLDVLIPLAISFSLTLMVLSYLWKDNPLFRLGVYLFIGGGGGGQLSRHTEDGPAIF
jgi:hypothetical protein